MNFGETVILLCTCAHAYQDHRYGANKRVFNVGKDKANSFRARCTVCGAEKAVNA